MPPKTIHAFIDDLAAMDAVAVAAAIRTGQLHPREVVAAAIARARLVDPKLHAIVSHAYERAERAAEAATPGPFMGVPTIIKDMIDVTGLPTKQGSEAFDDVGIARRTAPIAQQMFDMGMINLGKSSLPEFGFAPSAEFPKAEATRNPWNLDRTPGGSSSGSAALVAAGVLPIAHAADGGGSIRIPAACCGLVGLKPSRGRLLSPESNAMLPVKVVVDGVVTRSVRDTALYFAAAEASFYKSTLPRMGNVTTPLARRLHFGAIIDSPVSTVDAATRAAFERTAALLRQLGHEVEIIAPPAGEQFAEDFIHYYGLLAFSVRAAGKQLFHPGFDRNRLTLLTHGLGDRFWERVRRTPGVVLRLRRSQAQVAAAWKRFDAILSPVVGQLAPAVGHLGLHLPFEEVFPRIIEWAGFTPLANATGWPSISLPLAHDAETNLPIGMMFTAPLGQDALLLELALELESAAPWATLASAPPSAGA